ncbi:penicillin-binding protein 2 [Inquilinus sp. CAU 1745]|uniref:peptidoglycan D,D-transpeptidase FtsI family protein n=1 Tax=Inquilinus sp. CAU 1745 TaxID=3140369 RepID=UPI00325A7CF3
MSDLTADRFAETLPSSERRVRINGRAAQALETGRMRLMITGVVFALAFVTVGGRLVDATVLQSGVEPRLPSAVTGSAPTGTRAEITDRDGTILATTLSVASLYADPALILDPIEAADKLVTILPELDYANLVEDLAGDGRFVWIKRGLTPTQHYELNRLGIPGIAFQTEEQRIYPMGPLTSHIVGFTDIDGRGLAGIERYFNEQLMVGGEPLALSIDMRIQSLVRDELAANIEEFQAIGGAGIVMDVNTGEVLAMVSMPDFNPYEPATVPPETRFNRATLGVYEMGSTFKILNTAMALETGVVDMDDGFDATNPIRVGRFTINDDHPKARWLSVPEIFMYSSNIGSVQMAMAAGTPVQQEFMSRMGMLDPSPIEVPEVADPIIPDPWREINTMTIAFGHGMAVSSMQLVSAVSATVNGGILHDATLLRHDPGEELVGTRVISEQVSDQMRRLMRLVVVGGTGGNADAAGYIVGGKTGTAEKAVGGGYDRHALMSSFIAAFPMTDPQYVVFIMLDEPKGNESTYGYETGGWVAAPVVRRVIEQMAPMVGIPPIDEENPEVREALYVDLNSRVPLEGRLASYMN